ncbi:MAG: hypothetical protein ACKO13_12255 [Cytophagales bacterium]
MIREWGAAKGSWLGMKRIARCHSSGSTKRSSHRACFNAR